MADIRLKKITVEPLQSPLVIQNGSVYLTDSTPSSSTFTGALVVNGGIAVNCTSDVTSITSGGCFTVGGGVGVLKSLHVGNNLVLPSSMGEFEIGGLSESRMFVDTISNKRITFAPDGANKRMELTDTSVTFDFTKSSTSVSSGSLVIKGGVSVLNTSNAASTTEGGGLTVGGGVAIGKRLYVGEGITSILSNTLGNLFTTSANVGIGTTSPLTSLAITSNTIGPKITLWDGGSTGSHFGFGVSNTQLNYHIVTGRHVFMAGGKNGDGTELVCITSAGNVGINKSNPVVALDVVGSIQATSSANFNYNSNTLGSIITTAGNVGIGTVTPSAKLEIISSNTFGNVYLGLNIQNRKLVLYSTANNENQFTGLGLGASVFRYQAESTNTDHVFYAGSGAATSNELLRIKGSGNIGVGTTSPNYKLEVNGTGYFGNAFSAIHNSNTIGSILTTGGNVGIGMVPDAGNKLSVNGSAVVNYIRLTGNTSSNFIQSGSTYGSSALPLKFTNYNATSEWMTIQTNGNVGIGISAPSVSLVVVGSTLVTSGSLNASFNSNTVGSIVTTGGNVGIAKSNPSYTLDINGTLHANDLAIFSNSAESSGSSSGCLTLSQGGLSIGNTTNATSVTRGGGLTCAGGISVVKGMYLGGILNIKNTTTGANASSGCIVIDGGAGIKCTENSVSATVGGALSVAGGVAIAKDVWIGGNMTGAVNGVLSIGYIRSVSTEDSTSLTSGALITAGGITIKSTSNATSVTNGGGLSVYGGASFAKDIYIGGVTNMYNTINFKSSSSNIVVAYDTLNTKTFSIDMDPASKVFSVSRYDSLGNLAEKPILVSSSGITTFNNTTASTANNVGAVIVQGGLSIASTQTATSVVNGGSLSVYGGASVSKNVLIGGNMEIFSTTQSNDVSSGSLKVAGGVGISGNLNVLGNTVLNGNLTVRGTTTTVVSSNTVLNDNILVLNSGPSGTSDAGFVIQRYQSDNDSGTGDVVNDVMYITDVLPLQGAISASQIKLSSSASSVDNFYTGWWIKIGSGFSSNQVRKIISYTGSSRIATLSSAWTSQNPSNNDIVYLYNKSYVGLIYNEINDRFEFGGMVEDPGQSNTTFTDKIPVHMFSGTVVSTQPCTSITSGSFISYGGLCINNTSDASSVTNGGTLITLGGASIGKTLYVGTSMYVNGVNVTPNTGDIFATKTFSAANNQTSASSITDLVFSSSVWGFDVFLAAKLIATSNMYTNFHIRGVNKGSSWEIVKSYIGDDTGIEFFVTTDGQLQYTSQNYSGFSSLQFKYRSFTNG